jgi:hypothetical protein
MGAILAKDAKKHKTINSACPTLEKRSRSSASDMRAFFRLFWGPTAIFSRYGYPNATGGNGRRHGMLNHINERLGACGFGDNLDDCFESAEELLATHKEIDGYKLLAEGFFTGRRKAAKILSDIAKKDKETRARLVEDFSETFGSSMRAGYAVNLEIYSDLLCFLGMVDIVKNGLESALDGTIEYLVKPVEEAREKVILYCATSLILHGNEKEKKLWAEALSALPNDPRPISRISKKPNPYAGKKPADVIEMVKKETKKYYID